MKHKIDARGLACPEPVVRTKTKMKEFPEIEIIVDNETALENIKRLASSSGWIFTYTSSENNFIINIASDNAQISDKQSGFSDSDSSKSSTIVFSSNKMGSGDDELGIILMKAFIHTILSLETTPSKLIFYNSGVLLAAEGSGVIDDLQALQEKGVELLICGTCVNFYNIGEKIKAGILSNMFDILDTMNKSSRLINP